MTTLAAIQALQDYIKNYFNLALVAAELLPFNTDCIGMIGLINPDEYVGNTLSILPGITTYTDASTQDDSVSTEIDIFIRLKNDTPENLWINAYTYNELLRGLLYNDYHLESLIESLHIDSIKIEEEVDVSQTEETRVSQMSLVLYYSQLLVPGD